MPVSFECVLNSAQAIIVLNTAVYRSKVPSDHSNITIGIYLIRFSKINQRTLLYLGDDLYPIIGLCFRSMYTLTACLTIITS